MGGPSTEADEGYVCEQPHHQAPLCAVTHSKSRMASLLGSHSKVSGWGSQWVQEF